MAPKDHSPRILQFGVFEVDLAQGELRKNGQKIKLQDRPFQFLAALLERPGQLVTREELVRRLWNDTQVDFDNGLNIAAKKIREALADDPATPLYLETLPRRGYRFIAPVHPLGAPPAQISGPSAPPVRPSHTAIYARIAAVAVILFLAARIYWLATSVRPATLGRVVQLTQTGRIKLGNGVATDGTRVYFTERDNGRWSLAQVSVEGGTPLPLPLPLEQPLSNPDILDISPDRSNLLVSSGFGAEAERPLWVVPTVGGSLRRLGDLAGHAAAWSRDGAHIVFARGSALYLAAGDGSDARKLLDTPGIPYSIRWAPTTRADVLRFTLLSPKLGPRILYEVSADGGGLHPLLHSWDSGAAEPDGDDNGNFAANGNYYIFRALRNRVSSVYAMRAHRIFPRAFEGPPLQLYSTPMVFSSLAPSPDGKHAFFAAGQERRELVRYDSRRAEAEPFLSGVQATGIAFSRTGDWIAYSTSPNDTLWRSRADGTQRLQLTPPSLHAFNPRWSPDGAEIAFSGGPVGHASQIFVVPAAGGAPEPLTAPRLIDDDPDWSADGQSIVFARRLPPGISGQAGLFLLDHKAKSTTLVPGSDTLIQPAWSPDGRYIAATNRAGTQVLLLNLATHQWNPVATAQGLGPPFWSADSKYVYWEDVLAPDQPVLRTSVTGTKPERVLSAKQIPESNSIGYLLAGLDPAGAPIATVIYANSDIYALEVDLP